MKTAHGPLPAWDWVWVTLGPPKGHARATQGPPKRGAREDLRKCLCLQQKGENRPGGGGRGRAYRRSRRDRAESEKQKPTTEARRRAENSQGREIGKGQELTTDRKRHLHPSRPKSGLPGNRAVPHEQRPPPNVPILPSVVPCPSVMPYPWPNGDILHLTSNALRVTCY
jgi:hypothetical protein